MKTTDLEQTFVDVSWPEREDRRDYPDRFSWEEEEEKAVAFYFCSLFKVNFDSLKLENLNNKFFLIREEAIDYAESVDLDPAYYLIVNRATVELNDFGKNEEFELDYLLINKPPSFRTEKIWYSGFGNEKAINNDVPKHKDSKKKSSNILTSIGKKEEQEAVKKNLIYNYGY